MNLARGFDGRIQPAFEVVGQCLLRQALAMILCFSTHCDFPPIRRRRNPALKTRKNFSKIFACFQRRIASSSNRREIAVSGKTKDHGQCLTEETLTDYLEGEIGRASCRERLEKEEGAV